MVASGIRNVWIHLMQKSWWLADLQNACTCGTRDMLLSKVTPRFLADKLVWTLLTRICRQVLAVVTNFKLLNIRMNSVLLPFNLSLSTSIQFSISEMQLSRVFVASIVEQESCDQMTDRTVYLLHNDGMMNYACRLSPRGWVYPVKKIGPSTEP